MSQITYIHYHECDQGVLFFSQVAKVLDEEMHNAFKKPAMKDNLTSMRYGSVYDASSEDISNLSEILPSMDVTIVRHGDVVMRPHDERVGTQARSTVDTSVKGNKNGFPHPPMTIPTTKKHGTDSGPLVDDRKDFQDLIKEEIRFERRIRSSKILLKLLF